MFESEEVLRDLLHETPTLLLTGFPELDPRYCPDSPSLVSLGREIPLSSGPIDNLFIDPNGVLTLVECKGYWNAEIKRKVYSQAINYASDLQEMFLHFEASEFASEFERLILAAGLDAELFDLETLLVELESSESLAGKNLVDWRTQFLKRLEANIKDELDPGFQLNPDTYGYTIKNKSTGRSTYTQFLTEGAGLVVERHQIRGKEELQRAIEEGRIEEILGNQECQIIRTPNSRNGGRMYRLRLPIREATGAREFCRILRRVFVLD